MSFCVPRPVTLKEQLVLSPLNLGRLVFPWGCVGLSRTSSKWVIFWGLFVAYPVAVGWSLVFPPYMGVVQVGELAISMVTLYLWPNAPLTSRRYSVKTVR